MFITTSDRFNCKISINDELLNLKSLKENNPIKINELFQLNETIKLLTMNGSLNKLIKHCNSLNETDIIFYYIHQSMVISLINRSFIISDYFFNNGYPINRNYLPNLFIEILKSNNIGDSQCASIFEYLIMKGFEVNYQTPNTWLTPLHVAVKLSLYNTINLLLSNGSDVNAVANDDLMPLNIARNLLIDSSNKNKIIDLLLENGAKDTWRRDTITSIHANSLTKSNTMVSFRGGIITDTHSNDIDDATDNIYNININNQLSRQDNIDNVVVSDDGGMMFST